MSDASGCGPATTTVTITEPTAIGATISAQTNASCNGFSDGGATASGSGGTMPYTYTWSTGATTATATGLAAGTYTVSVTDAVACGTATTTVTITEPATLVAASVVDSNVTCNGFSDGGATSSATGGTMPYDYAWSNGDTTASATFLVAGTYTVTVTDANGCTSTSSSTITEPTLLVAATVVDSNTTCNGFSDGGATASATGGTGAYTYSWSNSATTASITGVTAGTYTVTVADANGCTDVSSTTITEPALMVASTVVDSNASCSGLSDGGATASGSGGTMPYTYAWSNSATTASITGVVAGTYSVTVTDANGCTDSASTTITEPASIVASTVIDSNVSCNGFSDGGATASGSGGTMPYTYSWSNSATTASITGVIAGTYSVTVTDANGCTDSASTTITEPTILIASSVVDSNVTCNGFSDGGATASATGGTGAYTYLWSNSATTASITGAVSGTYSVTVTDANGCTSTSSSTITEPTLLVAATVVDSNTTCNGFSDGGVTASATGGTGAYTYAWSNTATTTSITGVVAGTYTVTVTDNNGCTSTSSATITEPALMVASAAVDSNVSCNGFSDGGATASGAGGTMPYTYAWSNAATTASIAGVVAGTYSVTVTDANGCTDSASTTISEPAIVVASSVVDSNVTCNGFSNGGATASGSGGTMPYTYLWSNSATTASITGVVAGTYSVTVTDANGCTDSASSTITEPTTVVVSSVVDSNVTCNGFSDGGATVSATGGTGAYTYAWSNSATTASITGVVAGTYTVTVTDANGCTSTSIATITEPTPVVASTVVDSNVSCNGFSDGGATASATGGTGAYTYAWSNSATTASITGVVAGTYSVTVTDANGCTDSASINVTEPVSLVASASVDNNVSCNGFSDGGATASGTGGTMPYTYSWSNAATTASITGVVTGTYSVTITDANGCTDSASTTITEPTTLIASTVVDSNVTCNGFSNGGATASASGGTTPYSYSWSNSATASSITGISVGTYTVTVTDANGCTSTSSSTITEPTALVPVVAIDSNVSCNGFSDGGLSVTTTGGTGAYTYEWSNSATTTSINGLIAGTYTVTVTDANGCTAVDSDIIVEPALIRPRTSVDGNVSCFGLADGGLSTDARGGVGPYTYSWSNGGTTANITGLLAGIYTVTVTDSTGCSIVESDTITQPDSLIATTVLDSNVKCFFGNDGGASASATGGTNPYTYSWSNGFVNSRAVGLSAGTYTVTITDANGCTDTSSISISEPGELIATPVVDSTVSCRGGSDGGASTSVSGGTMPYSYSWSTTATTQSITGLSSGSYGVTVTDANGCTTSTFVNISQPTALVAATTLDRNVSCPGFGDGGATASGSGGTAPYSFNWSNGVTTASISGVNVGTYSVTVTDNNGCTDSSSIVIIFIDTIAPNVVTNDTTLYLDASGNASVTAAGIDNGSNDTCGIASLVLDTTSFDCNNIGANTVTLVVTDFNGNVDSATAIVTVLDTINPVVVTMDTTLYLDASGNASLTAADIDNGSSDACGVSTTVLSTTSFDCSSVGVNTVTLVVTDVNGNVDSATAVVTLVDSINPVVVTKDTTLYLDASGNASLTAADIDNGSSDACGVSTTVLNTTSFDCSTLGANTVTLVVTDVNGNVDSANATVTVSDTIIPTIVCPRDTTICSTTFTFTPPVGQDNCGIQSVVQTSGIPSGGTYPVGVTINTFVVTDVNGNVDSCSFTVTREPFPTVASAGLDDNICVNTYTLNGNTPVVGNGLWTSPNADVTILSPTSPTSNIALDANVRGEKTLIWTISNGVCVSSIDTVLITYDEEPTSAIAGSGQILCEEYQTTLSANTPSIGIGTWSVFNGTGSFNNANDPAAIVSGLSDNSNRFVWTISNGTCVDSRDTVHMGVAKNPIVSVGPDQTIFEDDGTELEAIVSFSPTDTTAQNSFTYQWTPSIMVEEPFMAKTRTSSFLEDSEQFAVRVVSAQNCVGGDNLLVTVNSMITLSSAFTPDGDGINDLWLIKNIDDESVASHKVIIFNGAGAEVFSSTNFKGWDGRYNGEDLPGGVSYYYSVEITRTNGDTEVQTGIVSILR